MSGQNSPAAEKENNMPRLSLYTRSMIRIVSYLVVIIIIGMTILRMSRLTSTEAPSIDVVQPNSLRSASDDEIAQVAIRYTQIHFKVITGTPQVLTVRSVIRDDLAQLGLSDVHLGGTEPPLELVVLKGDFDVRNLDRSKMMRDYKKPWPATYIVYVFDLNAGWPALTEVASNRDRFQTLFDKLQLSDSN